MNTVIKMLIVLCVIGVISGAALSEIDAWAQPKIAEHRKKATEEAIFVVQPEAKDYKKLDADFEVYQVFDESGSSLGYALPYEGNGFQGKIRIMIGLTDDLSQVIGLSVLEQVETPGLGTKITEEFFTSRFKDLKTQPEIIGVKSAAKNDNEVETITGATISAKAMIVIVNSGVAKMQEYKKQGGAS